MAALALAFVSILAAGCGKPAVNVAQLDSQFFASVQVIGKQGRGVGEFNKPRSLALDNQDNLYVVDLTGRVQKFTPEGKFVLQWQMPETDIGKPKGMIQDRDGNVIVVEPHYSRVNHFDHNGRLLVQWGVHGTNESQLTFPRCAAINSRGDIYVAEYGLVERVQYFSHNGKKFLGWFGQPGTRPGDLNRGEGIGIDKHDLVYVADSCNHRVQIFSPEGKFLEAFGTPGTGPGQMSYPYDIRVDELGYRFVCEFGNSRVQIFDPNNKPIETLGGAGADPGQMNNPWSIALDSQGNMYVADSMNHRVQKFIRREPYHITDKHPQNAKAAKMAALK